MDEEIMSMMRAILEAQERGLAWEPTSHHGFESSFTSQGGPLDGNYAHGNQSGYGAGYNAWEPTSHHGFDNLSTYQGGVLDENLAQENHSGYGEGYHAWEPTSHHGFERSPTYQGGLYAQENQSGYDEGYQSWDMQYDHGDTNSSPISIQEENLNIVKFLLEEQLKYNALINSFDFGTGSHSHSSRDAATELVESFNTELTTSNEENDRACFPIDETRPTELPPNDMSEGFEESAQLKDDSLQEAEWSVAEFEPLLGCTVDANLVLSYDEQVDHVVPLSYTPMRNVVFEDPCKGGLVVECIGNARESSAVMNELSTKDVIHVQTIPKMKTMASPIEDASKEGQEVGSPMMQHFAKHLGTLPTNEESMEHPWKLPFEEVRMREFGGWFYDEYDPGDPRFRRVYLDKSSLRLQSSIVTLNKRTWEAFPWLSLSILQVFLIPFDVFVLCSQGKWELGHHSTSSINSKPTIPPRAPRYQHSLHCTYF